MPGLLPAKLFGDKPPAAVTHISELHTPNERLYWLRPRAVLGVLGLLALIGGGVVAEHADAGVFTDGVQGLGVFVIIIGVMAFTLAVGVTWLEIVVDAEGDAPFFFCGMLLLTMIWSCITGILLATSEEFARRLAGLLTVTTVLLIFFFLLWYVVLHIVCQHIEFPPDPPGKDSDPQNVYHVLAAIYHFQLGEASETSAAPPTLYELLNGRMFKAWSSFYTRGVCWSVAFVAAGALLKAVDKDILELPELAVDIFHAVGELLACFGAAVMLVSLGAGLVEFFPAETLVEDIGFPERVRNRLACACISVPVCVFDAVWLMARGADLLNNSDAVALRCVGAVLLAGAGLMVLVAALHVALIIFGARLTQELEGVAGTTAGDAAQSGVPPPPDAELLPFPLHAMTGLHQELRSLGVGPYQAWKVLYVPPWRAWWHRRLVPVYLAAILALLSGITAAIRTEVWDPAPSAWIELLVPLFGEIVAVCSALCFLLSASIGIKFLPIRVECEAVFHGFNFIWLAARATHTFTFEKAALRLAGMIVMCISLNELRLGLKAVLVLAAKLSTLEEDKVKLLGRQPHSLPVLHVASLLANGGRWSVEEFQRELRRDRELRLWNRGMKTHCLGCILLAFFGGVLKDDIMIPVLDLMLDKKVMDESKHEDMHTHIFKPLGNILAGLGATLLLQRLMMPIAECLLWMLEAGLPNRLRCAGVCAASFNAMWLVTYGVFISGSDFRNERVVGILLITLAVARCAYFVSGGLILLHTESGPVMQPAKRYMVEAPVAAAIDKGQQQVFKDPFTEDSAHAYAAEEPIPQINNSAPHRPGYLAAPPEKPDSEIDIWQDVQSGAPAAGDTEGRLSLGQERKETPSTPLRPLHWKPVPQTMPMQRNADSIEPVAAESLEGVNAADVMPTVLGQTESPAAQQMPQQQTPAGELPGSTAVESPPGVQDPEVAKLPLLVQMGIVEPAASGETWLLTQLGRGWLLANFVASGWFFFLGIILQQHWGPLRDGEVNERAVTALVGAAIMVLTAINALICGLKLNGILKE